MAAAISESRSHLIESLSLASSSAPDFGLNDLRSYLNE